MTDSHHTEKQASPAQIRRWRYLAEERLKTRTYRALAERRTGEERQVLPWPRRGRGPRGHRHRCWENMRFPHRILRCVPEFHLPLAYMFGTIFILAMAPRTEERSSYDDDADVPAAIAADERLHVEVVLFACAAFP